MTKKNKKRSRRQRFIHAVEQRMLPVDKRDCPRCEGKGCLTKKSPFYYDHRPVGVAVNKVRCVCGGEGTMGAFRKVMGFSPEVISMGVREEKNEMGEDV